MARGVQSRLRLGEPGGSSWPRARSSPCRGSRPSRCARSRATTPSFSWRGARCWQFSRPCTASSQRP
eukprot:2611507-Pyramimonas_sp.AAC.1